MYTISTPLIIASIWYVVVSFPALCCHRLCPSRRDSPPANPRLSTRPWTTTRPRLPISPWYVSLASNVCLVPPFMLRPSCRSPHIRIIRTSSSPTLPAFTASRRLATAHSLGGGYGPRYVHPPISRAFVPIHLQSRCISRRLDAFITQMMETCRSLRNCFRRRRGTHPVA